MDFPSTQWGELAQATLHGDRAAHVALGEFCRRYRQPIVQVIRWRGVPASEAEDMAHDFFLHLMDKSVLRRADPTRGRFRSFLLGALRRFIGDAHDRADAQKRGGAFIRVDLNVAEAMGEPAPGVDTESATFDRAWAVALLDAARRQLEQGYRDRGQATVFAVLQSYLPGGLVPPSYEESSARLGLSVAAFKTEVHRLRQRFRERLRAEIARTVSAPQEIDAEIAYLGRVLQGSVDR